MLRSISLAIRKIQSAKKEKEILKTFYAWQAEVSHLPKTRSSKKLLLIRLDDIGDYIVYRNFLGAYKFSAKWKDYKITLLANIAWKDLFEVFDKNKVDNTIWIDKRKYFADEAYRKNIWTQLSNEAFEVVINPSRTRPLLLDDICALATSATKKIGCINTFKYADWNNTSDSLYNDLFSLKDAYIHEFFFNKKFAEWCCNAEVNIDAPQFETITKTNNNDYLIFFIGAASRSRRWTTKRWIELIKLVNKNYQYKIYITGGPADIPAANEIASYSNVENVAGKTSLIETINLIANARLVVSNNSMAAHAAVACNTPVVIVANGDNYFRFTQYQPFGRKDVAAVYTNIFLNDFKKYGKNLIHYEAVSADIATIKAQTVFDEMKKMLH